MADLKITELQALAGANVAAADELAIADISASETKKVTVTDLIGFGSALLANGTIPSAKINFAAGAIVAASLATDAVTTVKINADAVTGAKLADQSTCVVAASKAALDAVTGDFVGQLGLTTDTTKLYLWQSSTWQAVKAAGSINTISADTSGIVNITVSTSGDTATIGTSLDNTGAAGQFLAGPTGSAGAVSYRTIAGADLPTATTSAKGGVIVNGGGLTINSSTIAIDNTVTPVSDQLRKISYNAQGIITASTVVTGSDLPLATSVLTGAVRPGTGLSVDGSGGLNHSNSVTTGTYTKVTVDSQGHVSTGASLVDTDIPNIPASKLTSGTLNANLFGTNSITGAKLANYATVKFGGAGSTAGVVTFPIPEYTGQLFYDSTNGDLYLYDGNTWQPITVISGDLVYAGTYNANTNRVKSVTTQGSAAGFVANAALPAASATNLRYYVVVSDSGNGTAPAPTVALAPPDMIVSNGATWDLIDVSNAIAGQTASNISFTPYGNLAANNVQTALQELDDEKLAKVGGTVTGELLIGTTGSFAFEGTTDNAYETYLTAADPTADRTITFPDQNGNVIVSGNASIVNADINASAAIADTKLATISTAGKVSNSATTATNANTASAIVARDASGNFSAGTITATGFSGSGASLTSLTAGNLSGTIPSGVLGNSSLFVGTTSLALNRGSANQALTGISSIALPGSTSGTLTIQPAATAGVNTITFPAVTGNVVTTGDTGTVTGTMIADGTILNAEIASNAAIAYSKLSLTNSVVNADIGTSAAIADTKLATISTAGKVSNSATTATNANTASAIVARDASGNFSAGTITAALSGNASTATTLATARTIQGVSFDGSANITVVTAGTGISVAGTAVANTGVLSVNGSTGAVTNVAVTNAAQSFSAAQRGTVSALGAVAAGTTTLDFATANNFSLSLPAGGTVTLANPSNQTAGQSGVVTITQNGTTAATVAYGANWKFQGGAPSVSTTLSSVNVIAYYVESATRITAQLLTNTVS